MKLTRRQFIKITGASAAGVMALGLGIDLRQMAPPAVETGCTAIPTQIRVTWQPDARERNPVSD